MLNETDEILQEASDILDQFIWPDEKLPSYTITVNNVGTTYNQYGEELAVNIPLNNQVHRS